MKHLLVFLQVANPVRQGLATHRKRALHNLHHFIDAPLLLILMFLHSEAKYRGTGCGKAARPGIWGSGEVTIRSTRKWKEIQ